MKARILIVAVLCIALFQHADAWRRRRRRRRSDPPPPPPPPPNTPPGFYNCPQILPDQYTTTSTAVVTWMEPTCYDSQSSCTVSRSGPGSGSSFAEGYHSIAYTATDTGGLSAACTVSFTVSVIRCSPATVPQHGMVGCTQSNSVGSVCSFVCAEGLTLSGSNQRVCQELSGNTAQWSGTQPTCTDEHAPTVTYCPDTLTADRTENWGVEVSFSTPTAVDNFDQTLQVSTTPTDLRSPYNFTADTTCHYYFRDDAGNTATCTFLVTIHDTVVPEFTSCPLDQYYRTSLDMTPITWDEPTYRPIPGDEVRLTCNYGGNSVLLPWGDNHVIYTATNMKNGLAATCDFHVILEPMPCLALRAPAHGALSCDTWAYGRYCSMSCNKDYDIPAPSPYLPATDVYTCGSSGQWSPTSYIPDCSQTRDPTKNNLPTDLLYYSGHCGAPDTLDSIAQAFIETITKSIHSDVCKINDECTVSNVVVRCGWPTRRRKRRGVAGKQQQQSTHTADEIMAIIHNTPITTLDLADSLPEGVQEMRISMDLGVKVNAPNSTHQARDTLQNLAKNVLRVFLAQDEGLLAAGLDGEDSYLLLGEHDISCPDGYVPNKSKLQCVACSAGQFFDRDASACRSCGFGFYQDGYGQTECKPCPDGQSTMTESSGECREQCEAGYFSTSGFSPCIQCPLDTFQPLIGQTQCFECPDAKKTWNRGASDVEQCVTHLM